MSAGNVAAPRSLLMRACYAAYVGVFFLYLVAPLLAASMFAFHDALFAALPWKGFTLDWFFGADEPKLGMFHDRRLLIGMLNSLLIGLAVATLATFIGTTNAFLFERHRFAGQRFLFVLMVLPLVIPGVMLGISILVFASSIANAVEAATDLEITPLRPGMFLVILGQISFLTTVTTLVIAARLRKFDSAMEEAALNLGASPGRVLATVTLPFLKPSLIAGYLIAFLISFENFNTTLMLVGSDAPLTITMFDRMVKGGSTPVLNAVSLFLIVGSGALALINALIQRNPRH